MRSLITCAALGAVLLLGLACGAAPVQKWVADIGKAAQPSAVVVAADGTVYAEAGGKVLAFTPTGEPKVVPADFRIAPPVPATGPDGTTYVPTPCGVMNNATLRAVRPDGTQKWVCDIYVGTDFSPVAVAPDGAIYIITNFSQLHAITYDGVRKWVCVTAKNHSIRPPKVGDTWTLVTIADRLSSDFAPTVGPDGTVYACGENLHAFTPDGAEKWAFTIPGGVSAGPALGKDGMIYVGSAEGKLYAIADEPKR
jgi:outer membrane protein assembly factor BamB